MHSDRIACKRVSGDLRAMVAAHTKTPESKRNVVFGERLRRLRTGRHRPWSHVLLGPRHLSGSGASPAAAAAEQHNAVAADARGLAFVAVLVGVFVGLQPPLDVHLLAL